MLPDFENNDKQTNIHIIYIRVKTWEEGKWETESQGSRIETEGFHASRFDKGRKLKVGGVVSCCQHWAKIMPWEGIGTLF